MRVSPLLAALSCAALGSGCLLKRTAPLTLVSSATSDYSPVISFAAKVSVTDSVRITIDRARITAPGEVFPGARASTGVIVMQALLVTDNPNPAGAPSASSSRNGTYKPWREQSASGSLNIADSLVMGVPQTTRPLAFTIPLPANFDASKSWLVFRLTGPAKAMPAVMADGSAAPVFGLPDLRVFACAAKNLNGRTDKPRATVMAEAYSTAC